MKNYIIPVALSLAILACNKDEKAAKLAELEGLKAEQAELTESITKLQKEIDALGGADENLRFKNVAVSKIENSDFTHYIEIQGKVDADQNIGISAKMPGTITKVYARVGQSVGAGTVLAEMDNETIKLGIAELESGLSLATTMFQKQKALWDQKIGTEVQYLTAKNQKEGLEKKLASLKEQLEMSKIISPIAGTVDAVDIKIGQAVAPGIPAIRVVNFSNLKAKADVAESYSSKVKSGNDVIVSFPDLGAEINGKLSFAGRVINPMNRTFGVEVNLPSSNEYHPNMLAVLKIADYQSKNALVIPVNVIQNSEEGQYVMLVNSTGKNAAAKKALVKVGSISNGKAEILSGLNAGDVLISTGYQDLNEGDLIKF